MKKFFVILTAVIILIAVGIAGFNSSKGEPKNKEGISELPTVASTTTVASNGK